MNYSKHIFFTFLLAFLPMFASATHIVGGEMYYTCLGDDMYEVTLTVYRDCIHGSPNAQFDDPASIGVFDVNGLLLQNILVPRNFSIDDTLSNFLLDECFVVLEPVCVHTTTYTATIELPFLVGGYQLVYQRCCRNMTIVNIVEPLDVGATFSVNISDRALEECNNSAQFKDWPPLFICVNEPLVFDHSAFDNDGDLIIYKLCTPLTGADPDFPMPQPPNNPPYAEIPWKSPYDDNNMLGGVPLAINAQSGLLTAIPDTVGQFVVGVCAEEWRDGELISSIRRDFQYNVGLCGTTTSAFFAPELQCESFTVDFDNQSFNADEFIWYFNDPNNPGASSTLSNPSYTYSDTGSYTVMLVAEPNNSCRDTAYQEIQLNFNSLIADFEYDFIECTDSMVIQVTNLSTDAISTITDLEWTLTTNQGVETSFVQNPEFIVHTNGEVTLSLWVLAENGCEKTWEQTFFVELLEDELVADTLQICKGDSIYLNSNGVLNNATYQWATDVGLSDPTDPNPLVQPDTTTTYTVTITGSSLFCQIERSITIIVPTPVTAEAPPDTTTCESHILLNANTNFGIDFIWATDLNFNNVIAEMDTVTVTPFGEKTYYLLVRDQVGCVAYDSVTIVGNGVNTAIENTDPICEGDTIELFVFNFDPVDTLTFVWSPIEDILEGDSTNTPTILPSEAGVHTYFLTTENQFGCIKIDSTQIGVLDTTDQADFVAFQQCAGYSIQFTNTSINAPFYEWTFGDPNNPTAISNQENPTYIYSEPGIYEVTLAIAFDVNCPDTIVKQIEVVETLIDIDFAWEFESCSDSVIIAFTDLSTNSQSDFINWEWQFSNGEDSDLQNPTLIIYESQDLEALLTIASSDGCMDTLSQLIPIEIIESNLSDTLVICPNIPTFLNPSGNPDYTYLWFPATGLDDPTSPNPLATLDSTTTYTVLISDELNGFACEIERTMTVFVPPAIELAIEGEEVICVEETDLSVLSNQATSFTWSESPTFNIILGESAEITVAPNRPSTYYVRGEDSYGCVEEETFTVGNYEVEIEAPDVTLCIGDTVQLMINNANPADELNVVWSPENAIISGALTESPLVNPNVSTLFIVEAMNQFGCTVTDTAEVIVLNTPPLLEVAPVLDTVFLGDQIQLTSTGSLDYTYFWTPSNSLNLNDVPNPIAMPEVTTTYTLFVRDTTTNCTNSRELTLIVITRECNEPFIFVPSGFTPNGDGKNDDFQVYGNNIDEFYLAVYNRWGQKVFESFSQSEKWDGTWNGKALPPEVFGYYLKVSCLGGGEFFKKGNVTLLR